MSQIFIQSSKTIMNSFIRLNSKKLPKYFQIRTNCKENKLEKEEVLDHPSYTYKDTKLEYAVGKMHAVRTLQGLFNLQKFPAAEIVADNKELRVVPGKIISNNYKLLKANGISEEAMLKYPKVLAVKHLEFQIAQLEQIRYPLSETFPLLMISTTRLVSFIKFYEDELQNIKRCRLKFLSTLLKIPVVDVCEVLTRRDFLLRISLDKIKETYTLLTEFGITVEEIQKDYWVLKYNTEMIRERLDLARKLNLDKIKTWMVRAQTQIFERYIQRRTDNKSILGDNSIVEYLAEHLECSLFEAKGILVKHPALSSKNMKTLQTIIDFLNSDGFTPHHILRNPKILLHSLETTKQRLKEIRDLGIEVDSLHVLTKSKKQYLKYFESLDKSNKTKIKSDCSNYLLVLFSS